MEMELKEGGPTPYDNLNEDTMGSSSPEVQSRRALAMVVATRGLVYKAVSFGHTLGGLGPRQRWHTSLMFIMLAVSIYNECFSFIDTKYIHNLKIKIMLWCSQRSHLKLELAALMRISGETRHLTNQF